MVRGLWCWDLAGLLDAGHSLQFRLNPAPMDDAQKQVFAIMPWVLMFVMWLIVQLIGSAVSMPAQIIGMIAQMASYNIDEQSTDWKMIETVLMSLGEVMKTIIGSVAMITMALQFYNLKEKNDGQFY